MFLFKIKCLKIKYYPISNKIKSFLIKPLISRSVHSVNIYDPNPDSDGAKIGDIILTTKHGINVLLDPLLNKGTGFPMEERERLNIRGLVPPRLPSHDILDWQVKKIMTRYHEYTTALGKYSYINNLQDRNEVLFFRCLVDHLEEIAPIIYTPTVGEACINYATLFRKPRGMYFSALDRGHMHAMTYNWHCNDVELIVVTDGSRILGLGDLGTNGMGIPIGKLALYTAGAGIHPSKCLPVVIDVGTNNQDLLEDSMYLGLQQKRLTGKEYDDVIHEFIQAVKEKFPKALIQFEDFSTDNAARILEKYRNKILCFNDDMQGTATVALAGILSALKAIGHKKPHLALCEQKIIVAGAGSAGLGVARGLLFSMVQSGMSEIDAYKRIWIIDENGALGAGRKSLFSNQEPWIRHDVKDNLSLEKLIQEIKPTILLGLTGYGGLFKEKSIREMAKHCDRPILFPLSNPTSKAECTAIEAYTWTNGKCIFASGSPFPQVDLNGKTFKPAQANNMYTFPGIGLGALVCQAKSISDTMLNAAALALADCVSEEDLLNGRIFPRVCEIPRISKEVAFAVAKQALKENLAKLTKLNCDDLLKEAINDRFWTPKYGCLVRVDPNQI